MAKDSVGRQIKVGDTIVYPGRRGSRLYIRHAVVESVKTRKGWNNQLEDVLVVSTMFKRYNWNASPAQRESWKLTKSNVGKLDNVTVTEFPITQPGGEKLQPLYDRVTAIRFGQITGT